MTSKIHDLYNGDEILSWTDEDFAEVVFCGNGETLSIPKESFHNIVEELVRASKMLQLLDKTVQAG
jgi:hypothetical protein